MNFSDVNPYVRHIGLQPSALSSAPLGCARDHRIFYVLQGEADLVLQDQRLAVAKGTLVYLPSATPYYFDGNIKVIVVNFDLTQRFSHIKETLPISKDIDAFSPSDALETDLPQELRHTVLSRHAADLESDLVDCLPYRSHATVYAEAILSANLKKILCRLLQKKNEPLPPMPSLVREVLLYIEQHYDSGLTNEQIASVFGYHSFYLNRIFKKATGRTLHQCILAQQIDVAKNLLEHTKLSVKAISCEVGFSDASLFCTTFKKQTGLTPSEYRSQAIS